MAGRLLGFDGTAFDIAHIFSVFDIIVDDIVFVGAILIRFVSGVKIVVCFSFVFFLNGVSYFLIGESFLFGFDCGLWSFLVGCALGSIFFAFEDYSFEGVGGLEMSHDVE